MVRLKKRESRTGINFNDPEEKRLYQQNWRALHRDHVRETGEPDVRTGGVYRRSLGELEINQAHSLS